MHLDASRGAYAFSCININPYVQGGRGQTRNDVASATCFASSTRRGEP